MPEAQTSYPKLYAAELEFVRTRFRSILSALTHGVMLAAHNDQHHVLAHPGTVDAMLTTLDDCELAELQFLADLACCLQAPRFHSVGAFAASIESRLNDPRCPEIAPVAFLRRELTGMDLPLFRCRTRLLTL